MCRYVYIYIYICICIYTIYIYTYTITLIYVYKHTYYRYHIILNRNIVLNYKLAKAVKPKNDGSKQRDSGWLFYTGSAALTALWCVLFAANALNCNTQNQPKGPEN